ncbi:type II and III secretion system protein family protein [Parasphingorhabdus flavimaris]|uniref:Type II and III secretion system protein family protein n=1 Tax=Parasphingorhabdus flavimaris TaxID=266812 RepID=A0ABX2N3T1_9SPHN|nr:type II and III secretion system protein family protein [Parasphingorhabdus flavimaris]NVD28366.1 type II and III secretion system protein family protein [Parasphingorhabdus flavimaris]
MLVSRLGKRLSACTLLALACTTATTPLFGQSVYTADQYSGAHGGQLDVPLNKSQILNVDRNFSRAMIGNDEIADILPMTNRSLYVLGKQMGTTSLTLYDSSNRMISVVDVAVGPDVVSLRRQLEQLIPGEKVGANISNDSIVLTGVVSNAPAVDRAVQLARTYAGDNVVNMMSVGGTQQVMLEVRFSEMNRQVGKQMGLNAAFMSRNGRFQGGFGTNAPSTALLTNQNGNPTINIGGILESFGIVAGSFNIGNLDIFGALDALERKGVVKTLAEPTLIALSGERASFLAGGEFPVPIAQSNGDGGNGSGGITVEFKPFGVSLAFTPTVLADGVINLVVEPEVSSIDPSASISVNGLVIPGLQTRRANTTLELRDGQSFAIAGLIRQDFQDTVRQFPILGSIPIIGSLFRSTSFAKQETELVIIVTPRLVQPMKADMVSLPTDRVKNPTELELFLMGRTDKAVGVDPFDPDAPPPEADTTIPAEGGFIGPNGYEF